MDNETARERLADLREGPAAVPGVLLRDLVVAVGWSVVSAGEAVWILKHPVETGFLTIPRGTSPASKTWEVAARAIE